LIKAADAGGRASERGASPRAFAFLISDGVQQVPGYHDRAQTPAIKI